MMRSLPSSSTMSLHPDWVNMSDVLGDCDWESVEIHLEALMEGTQ